MLKKLILITLLTGAAPALAPQTASAMPLAPGASASAVALDDSMIQKVWHSGLPHRRVIGTRVYGGTCPPQGCPLWTQRDITPDPITGKYRWRGAPPGTAYGWGTYAAPGGYYFVPPEGGAYYRPYRRPYAYNPYPYYYGY